MITDTQCALIYAALGVLLGLYRLSFLNWEDERAEAFNALGDTDEAIVMVHVTTALFLLASAIIWPYFIFMKGTK